LGNLSLKFRNPVCHQKWSIHLLEIIFLVEEMPPTRRETLILMKKWGAAMPKSKITVKLSGQKATVEALAYHPFAGATHDYWPDSCAGVRRRRATLG
jgi:hypothetical protein